MRVAGKQIGVYHVNGRRLASARRDAGLKQTELLSLMREYVSSGDDRESGEIKISTGSSISAWESGRRPCPSVYAPVLAGILGVGLPYLYGVTDDKGVQTLAEADAVPSAPDVYSGFLEEAEADLRSHLITEEILPEYDGRPVFIEYPFMEHESCWGIYDERTRKAFTRDGVLCIGSLDSVHLYSMEPYYRFTLHDTIRGKKALSFEQVRQQERVLVVYNTANADMRWRYSGWYTHNYSRTGLVSLSTAEVLPYEGLGIAYRAFSPV